jgi:hypothetical protein
MLALGEAALAFAALGTGLNGLATTVLVPVVVPMLAGR